MATAARLDLARNQWVLTVPPKWRPRAIPLDWPWAVRDGVMEVPGGGRVSGAGEVPCAREVASRWVQNLALGVGGGVDLGGCWQQWA